MQPVPLIHDRAVVLQPPSKRADKFASCSGGYEGAESMIYYGHHGPWAPIVEENILRTFHELAGAPKK